MLSYFSSLTVQFDTKYILYVMLERGQLALRACIHHLYTDINDLMCVVSD